MRRTERQRLQIFVVAALVVGGVLVYRTADNGDDLPAWDGPHGVSGCVQQEYILNICFNCAQFLARASVLH